MKKKNCWEVTECGREPGGGKVAEFGTCPAATETRTDGLNEGVNAGRACWAVTGTFCDNEVSGRFASKITSCLMCDFYQRVCREQGEQFQGTGIILDKLRKKKVP